jgi:hypothetical protein
MVKKRWRSEINSEWKINIKTIKNDKNTSYKAFCKLLLTFVAPPKKEGGGGRRPLGLETKQLLGNVYMTF